eukprot:TRINITY_DN18952_c0_g1_i1.p1 TRINITY_DN18952_c0_g1~~TRINITY_DN18952_c0_g1_i1.p1  ORF type:complete len:1155 (+),score=151.88 TRINITY_DN18952_c0_g1_i1:75-3467(+)
MIPLCVRFVNDNDALENIDVTTTTTAGDVKKQLATPSIPASQITLLFEGNPIPSSTKMVASGISGGDCIEAEVSDRCIAGVKLRGIGGNAVFDDKNWFKNQLKTNSPLIGPAITAQVWGGLTMKILPWCFRNSTLEPEAVQTVLDHPSSDINYKESRSGFAAIHYFALHGLFGDLLFSDKYASKLNVDLQASTAAGNTALHLACLENQGERIVKLLGAGASCELADRNGDIAAHLSIKGMCATNIVSMILNKMGKGNPILNQIGSKGTLLGTLSRTRHSYPSYELTKLLIDYGVDVNIADHLGAVPIASAASLGHIDFVRCVIDCAKSVEHPLVLSSTNKGCTKDGIACLENGCYSLEEDSVEVVRLILSLLDEVELIAKGKITPPDIDIRDIRGRTPIIAAAGGVEEWSWKRVELLLQRGADITLCDNSAENALIYACTVENMVATKVVQLLLKEETRTWEQQQHLPLDRQSIVNQVNIDGDTPAMLIARNNHSCSLELMKMLINHAPSKCNIDFKNNKGDTALMHTFLNDSDNESSVPLARLLLEQGADRSAVGLCGDPLVILACLNETPSNIEFLKMVLEFKDLNVNEKNDACDTALAHCSRNNHDNNYEMMQLLLEHPDIDVNIQNERGNTALLLACSSAHPNAIKMASAILRSGADPNILNAVGDSALLFAVMLSNRDGTPSLVKSLLDAGARTDVRGKDDDPLITLACLGQGEHNVDVLKILLSHIKDVDINALNGDGDTTVMHACRNESPGAVEMLRLLLERFSELDLNVTGNFESNAFLKACRNAVCGDMLVRILLEHAAIPGRQHKTPSLFLTTINASDDRRMGALTVATRNEGTGYQVASLLLTSDAFDVTKAYKGNLRQHYAVHCLFDFKPTDLTVSIFVDHVARLITGIPPYEYDCLVEDIIDLTTDPFGEDHSLKMMTAVIEALGTDFVPSNNLIALRKACARNYTKVGRLLLKNGVDPNAILYSGKFTPLYEAAKFGSHEMVAMLVDEFNATSTSACNPLCAFLEHYIPSSGTRHVRKTLAKLISAGCDINSCDGLGNPLTLACRAGAALCEIVLSLPGIDVNATNSGGLTALSHACKCGYRDCVKLILDSGGETTKDGPLPTPFFGNRPWCRPFA